MVTWWAWAADKIYLEILNGTNWYGRLVGLHVDGRLTILKDLR